MKVRMNARENERIMYQAAVTLLLRQKKRQIKERRKGLAAPSSRPLLSSRCLTYLKRTVSNM
jgi:hypothetical protein